MQHELEKKLYGPESILDAKAKILLYIRHRALRDWTKRKRIPMSEIIASTGVERRTALRAIDALERSKDLLVTRKSKGKVKQENIYELHPEKYGTDYIHKPKSSNFHIIYGGKGHKSNKMDDPKKLSTKFNTAHTPSDNSVTTPSDIVDTTLVTQLSLGRHTNNMESLENLLSKNPILKRTLLKELSSGNDENLNNTGDQTAKIMRQMEDLKAGRI